MPTKHNRAIDTRRAILRQTTGTRHTYKNGTVSSLRREMNAACDTFLQSRLGPPASTPSAPPQP